MHEQLLARCADAAACSDATDGVLNCTAALPHVPLSKCAREAHTRRVHHRQVHVHLAAMRSDGTERALDLLDGATRGVARDERQVLRPLLGV